MIELEKEIQDLIIKRMSENPKLTVSSIIFILQRLYKQSLQNGN